jgi:hypothetical protein
MVMVMSGSEGLRGIRDEREDLHLELFLAIAVQVIPLLLLFFVGNVDLLVAAAVIRRLNILSVIVTLKRQKD